MNHTLIAGFWALTTLAVYGGARLLNRRLSRWWSSPLLVTWVFCGFLIVVLRSNYAEYLTGTHWLVVLLGPATISFAVPIHRHRALIMEHWVILSLGVIAGCAIAVGSSWFLARCLDLPADLRASLLPRSITTPLAMATSTRLGGIPELTATFTAITGLFGAAVGDMLLAFLPLRTSFARGALFGMGAHGAGVARAREIGQEEGAIAGLIMILAGLVTVIGVSVVCSLL
jgi:putative effector of murein hydrolase